MVGVKVVGNDLNTALKKFSSVVYHSGIMLEYNERRFFTKPSDEKNVIKQKYRRRKKYNNRNRNKK